MHVCIRQARGPQSSHRWREMRPCNFQCIGDSFYCDRGDRFRRQSQAHSSQTLECILSSRAWNIQIMTLSNSHTTFRLRCQLTLKNALDQSQSTCEITYQAPRSQPMLLRSKMRCSWERKNATECCRLGHSLYRISILFEHFT